jgi:hypothetical protein
MKILRLKTDSFHCICILQPGPYFLFYHIITQPHDFSFSYGSGTGVHTALVRINEELLERKVAAPV